MKKLLVIMMALLLSLVAFATTIKDIQYTTDASGDSPLKGQEVTISGIVTAEPYAFGGSEMYIQDGPGAWNGIYVYLGKDISNFVPDSVIVSEGDSVTITGTVDENYNLTRIKDVTALTVDAFGIGCPAPAVLTAAEAGKEDYEGCLVRLLDVDISNPDLGYGEWEISDASGTLGVDDEGGAPYYFWPDEYDNLLSITGVMNYSFSARKIVPRLAWDIVEGPLRGETIVHTRIQRIQQVRHSDLLKTPLDGVSDKSYLDEGHDRDNPADTTLYIRGVVTMPTGLSYAGDGVKMILSDLHGGPWSAILSYNRDASVYPDMYAGDYIDMSGYIGEYTTTSANMTEFFLVGDANFVGDGIADLPDTAIIKTGDLRVPATAEQWGNNIVKIENALVTSYGGQYDVMIIDDGTGTCLIYDDSDSLDSYSPPPLMTPIESITGWVYHHHGSYVDSTTYNLNPLYEEDIVLGEGPAMILFPKRKPAGIPTPAQTVAVSATISTVRNVETAKIYYRIDNGDYADVDMIEGESDVWTGTIPAQATGSIVEYYFYVVDDSTDVSALPTAYEEGDLFSYKVLDGAPTIYDIQYTHAENGLSPLSGAEVTFDAYVTFPGQLSTNFKDSDGKAAITVASAPGPWNAVWVLADPAVTTTLNEGDLVTVSGLVDDDHESYWKYENNTWVIGDITVKLAGEAPIAATELTLEDLASNPESFEGVKVALEQDMEISSINDYDFSISDGLNTFLYDDDFVADSILDINFRENVVVGNVDTLVAGDSLSAVKGVVMYSYGSMKIEARELGDVTIIYAPGVDPGVGVDGTPVSYALHQNFPNPFNPLTTIRFELANSSNVKLSVYDINGRLVQELLNKNMNPGAYDLRWNAAHLSSGMYLYRIETPEFTATNKMLLLK